jgi:hypothetical protein
MCEIRTWAEASVGNEEPSAYVPVNGTNHDCYMMVRRLISNTEHITLNLGTCRSSTIDAIMMTMAHTF